MFPLRDVIPSRTTPVVTYALIAVNLAVFLWESSLGESALTRVVFEHGLVPASFSVGTLVTSMFLHSGWMHVLGNMWFLWIFGDNVEDRLGHGRYLLFYFLSGAVAALVQTLVSAGSQIPMIGASGAIAGIMGAYLVLFPTSRVQVLIFLLFFIDIIEIPAVFFLGFWFLLQMVSGVGALGGADMGGVAFWAHLGGFLLGVLTVKLWARPERQRVDWWNA